jgi:hypothetical protein
MFEELDSNYISNRVKLFKFICETFSGNNKLILYFLNPFNNYKLHTYWMNEYEKKVQSIYPIYGWNIK